MSPELPTSVDVVVVGAGSAGCVVARRLVDAGVHVVLVEAGGPDDNPAIHEPARMFELYGGPDDWGYSTVEQAGGGGRSLPYPRGKVMGGSSSLNAMIYARGPRTDYDTWAYLGNGGWGYDDVLPVFKRSEDFDGGASEHHGGGGPLHVLSRYEPHPLIAALKAAAQEAGIAPNPDYNAGTIDGVSQIQLNVKDGERHNAARAFVAPVAEAPNLTVLTRCFVQRLLLERSRCVGVEVVRDGRVERIRAEHEVVVCAGAVDSPKLLMLSGIGPFAELARLGIEAHVDLAGVGQHLQDHPYSAIVYSASRPVPPAVPGLQQAHAHLFWRSRPGLPGPDVESLLVHVPVYVNGDDGPPDGFTLPSMLVRPASTGTVRLRSSDPTAPPLIDPGFLRCRADLDAIVAGLELCREIARQHALGDWRGTEVHPGAEVRTKDELRAYVRASVSTIFHPTSTCRMGVDDLAVVDPDLRVYGVEGLRVADASIMPLITSANTHAPTVMIGERAAELVVAALGAGATAAAAAWSLG